MSILKRRTFLQLGSLGAGALAMPGLAHAQAKPAEADPHFFVLIMLGGGADPSYMYDGRPLAMTTAGRIQNYLGEDPVVQRGRNGTQFRASSLMRPLARLHDRFSVINGIYMTPSFDGHLQNMNYLLTGDPFGGESFVPHLNAPVAGRTPDLLDAVVPTSSIFGNFSNNARVVPLQPQTVTGLAEHLKRVPPLRQGEELGDFVQRRMAAIAQGKGRFAAGASAMLSGLTGADEMHRRLAQLRMPDEDWNSEEQAVALMAQCFRLGIARSAICLLPENFDVHSPEQARLQPQMFASAVERIVTLFDGLIETPYDAKRSLLDVTTVMVASEFGRTMRSTDLPVQFTGTHHNVYCNSVWLGGRGVRPGMVIGESDLQDERAKPSPAHLALDPRLEKLMGQPFDFATLKPRDVAPESFDIGDYITINSIVNTVYALFDLPKSRWRNLGRDLPIAPVLQGLCA